MLHKGQSGVWLMGQLTLVTSLLVPSRCFHSSSGLTAGVVVVVWPGITSTQI